jgi:hypothetical protein
MQRFFLAPLVLILTGGLSSSSQDSTRVPAPAEVILSFSTEGDRHQFHLGELMPVRFSYAATAPGRYIWVSQSSKLTEGHTLQVTCSPSAEPVSRSPLPAGVDDKFGQMLNAPCGGVGSGFGGGCGDCDWERPLSPVAMNFGPIPLNTYIRFRTPGAYTCTASSAEITTASSDQKARSALPVKSNPLDLTIVDDPRWTRSAVAGYADAYDRLCIGDHVVEDSLSQCFDIAARITYFDSLESLSTEVKFFDGRNHGWDNGFWDAIQHCSYPADAVRLLTKRIQDPDVEVSTMILESLASWDLRIESPEAFEDASPASYHSQAVETLGKYIRLLGASLSRKDFDVVQESAKTYRVLADQEYCEERPLIPRHERDGVLAIVRMRP